MRIATWNVNSLKARLERVASWIDRARPDVLLLQETKLTDAAAPRDVFERWGYELAHHGQGRWNGVAIASRVGIADVARGFGDPAPAFALVPTGDEEADTDPFGEARMIAATVGGARGVRVVSLYVPNGRLVGSPFYRQKLAWFERLSRWLAEGNTPGDAVVLGGDFNVAPKDLDVWDPRACHGGTHVSGPERAAVDRLAAWGLVDAYRLRHEEAHRYSWWDYRAGDFHKNKGMRIDLLLVSAPVVARVVFAEIDREARKGKPTPSDHAPVIIDLDEPGVPLDAGWEEAEARIATRVRK